jgi:hypothetical protein
LLHDEALADAEAWAADHPEKMDENAKDLLVESHEAEAYAAKRQRLQTVIRGVAALAIVIAGALFHFLSQAQQGRAALQETLAAATASLAEQQEAQAALSEVVAAGRAAQARAQQQAQKAQQRVWDARHDVLAAQSRALAAEAQALLAQDEGPQDTELPALLALEALRLAGQLPDARQASPSAQIALHKALGQPTVDPALPVTGDVTLAWLSADGRALTAGPDGGAVVWDAVTGRRLSALLGQHGASISYAVWSPSGDRVVTADVQGGAVIWDADRGLALARFRWANGLNALTWSPDGERLVAMSRLGAVRAWEAASGAAMWRWQPRGHDVIALEWSETGLRLTCIYAQGGFAVLDARSGGVVDEFQQEGEQPLPLKGYIALARVEEAGMLRLQGGDALRQTACARLSRNLTRDEWARYVGPDAPYRRTCPDLPPGE